MPEVERAAAPLILVNYLRAQVGLNPRKAKSRTSAVGRAICIATIRS
jgi:hypothetical protein